MLLNYSNNMSLFKNFKYEILHLWWTRSGEVGSLEMGCWPMRGGGVLTPCPPPPPVDPPLPPPPLFYAYATMPYDGLLWEWGVETWHGKEWRGGSDSWMVIGISWKMLKEKNLKLAHECGWPRKFSSFLSSRHSIACLVKYCIQIIYTNK